MNFNVVILGGRLTRDPEIRYTPSGAAVTKFGLAIGRKYKTESGEEREEVVFVDVTAWNRTAEVIGQYFKKGSPILIEGRLKLDQWEDRQTGEKKSRITVVARSFQFAGGKREEGEGGGTSSAPPRRPATGKPATAAAEDGPPPEEDDVPF